MPRKVVYSFHCDHANCHEEFSASGMNQKSAEFLFGKRGWTAKGTSVYCPTHSKQ